MMPCVGMPCVGRPGGAWYGGIVCGIGGAQPAGKGGAPGKGIWYPGGWPLHDSAPPGALCEREAHAQLAEPFTKAYECGGARAASPVDAEGGRPGSVAGGVPSGKAKPPLAMSKSASVIVGCCGCCCFRTLASSTQRLAMSSA